MSKTEATSAPKFQALSFAALPKRKAPERSWDRETADALLAVVQGDPIDGNPPTATDGVQYADEKAARAAANSAKRLLRHVAPDGLIVKSATFGFDAGNNPVQASASAGKFGFSVWLAPAPEPKAAKASK